MILILIGEPLPFVLIPTWIIFCATNSLSPILNYSSAFPWELRDENQIGKFILQLYSLVMICSRNLWNASYLPDKNKLKLHLFCNNIDSFFPLLSFGIEYTGSVSSAKTSVNRTAYKSFWKSSLMGLISKQAPVTCFRGYATGMQGVFFFMFARGFFSLLASFGLIQNGLIQNGFIFCANYLWAVTGVPLVSE